MLFFILINFLTYHIHSPLTIFYLDELFKIGNKKKASPMGLKHSTAPQKIDAPFAKLFPRGVK
jgi:hypothetical protein